MALGLETKSKVPEHSLLRPQEIKRPHKGNSTPSLREEGWPRLVLTIPSSSPAFPSVPPRTLRTHQEVIVVIMPNILMFHGSWIAFTFLFLAALDDVPGWLEHREAQSSCGRERMQGGRLPSSTRGIKMERF